MVKTNWAGRRPDRLGPPGVVLGRGQFATKVGAMNFHRSVSRHQRRRGRLRRRHGTYQCGRPGDAGLDARSPLGASQHGRQSRLAGLHPGRGCTVAGNSAGYGGGIQNSGTLTINNSTLSGNSAPAGEGGGIYNENTLTLNNCIVAGNTAQSAPNIYGAFSGSDNLTTGIPLLAPLGNYGGPTQTMPPLFGSAAIDNGDDSVTSFLTSDQRGYPRLSGSHVDIGAVEAQWAPANNPPHLVSPARSTATGTFQFMFTNAPAADFTVLASTNVALPLADWSAIGLMTMDSPGQYQFTDAGTTNYPHCFYQVVSP